MAEAAEPAPSGDGRDARELAGGIEGDPLLPADDEEPELAIRDLHARKPGDRGSAERAAAAGAAIPLLRASDMIRPAARTKDAFPERHPGDEGLNLGLRGNLL